MGYLRYVRSLGLAGIILYPHEIGHWLVARTWTRDVRIVPVPREEWSYRFQFAAAQVKAPIPEHVPVYRVRLAAVGPMVVWGLMSVVVSSVFPFEYLSPSYLIVGLFFTVSGGVSVDDVNTFFRASHTKDMGGFGAEYAELERWVIPIWLVVITLWVTFEIVVLTYVPALM